MKNIISGKKILLFTLVGLALVSVLTAVAVVRYRQDVRSRAHCGQDQVSSDDCKPVDVETLKLDIRNLEKAAERGDVGAKKLVEGMKAAESERQEMRRDAAQNTGQSAGGSSGGSCDPNKWGSWSTCSKTCGGGTQSRTNACGTNQSQACNTQVCPTNMNTSVVATATPVPPTVIVAGVCPRKGAGDANCDGNVSGGDYSVWLNSQCMPAAGQTCADTRADFNSDGNVDDGDYNIWFTNRNT